MQGEYFEVPSILEHVRIQHMRHALDLLDGSQEDKNISLPLFAIDVDNGLKGLKKEVLGGPVEVMNGNLMQPAGDVDRLDADEFGLLTFIILVNLEESLYALVLHGGRGDNHLQIVPHQQYLLQEAEEDIEADRSLMHVVQHYY